MEIKSISIHIQTEGMIIKTVFKGEEQVGQAMGANIKFHDLIFDIINKAKEDNGTSIGIG